MGIARPAPVRSLVTPTPESSPPGFQGTFTTDQATLEAHSGSRGPFRFVPRSVATPSGPDDLSRLVRWAGREGRVLVPRGAATGMPGGNVGRDVVVDLRAGTNWMSPVDRRDGSVRVGAGAVAADVERVARAQGLRFPPLPSSAQWATIGGMIANNAAGARTFLHGATRPFVESLEVVLADGRRIEIRDQEPAALGIDALPMQATNWPAVRKNSSGYAFDAYQEHRHLRELFIGSEGTLGFITAATLRLVEAPAATTLSAVACTSHETLARWCAWARRSGASTCEFIGRRLLEMMDLASDPELGDLAKGARALVLIEFEGTEDEVGTATKALEAEARAHGDEVRVATRTRAATELWELRHRASPLIQEAAARGLRSIQFIEDSVVPPHGLAAYLEGVETILEEEETDGVLFGHAGDAHVHVNPLIDVERSEWRSRVGRILERTVDLVVHLGGTLAGEHGDGRVRAPFLERIWGEQRVSEFRALKGALDPGGVFNPGVMLPQEGQKPLEGLSPRDPERRDRVGT